MPLILPGNVASATAPTTYSVANSVRFNRADSPTLLKAFGTPTNHDKWTFSIWCKRSGLGTTQNLCACQSSGTKLTSLRFDSDNTLNFYDYTGAYNGRIATNRFFSDPTAWYHIVIVWDSGNATAGNRMRMYVNGIEETSFGTDTNPDQNLDSDMNTSGENLDIGHADDGNYFDGYLAEAVFCDGQTYAASDFGEFNEDSPTIWQPKDVSTLTFGSNGGYYDFEDSANLGNDANGGTDLTEANLAAADQATDTPTNNFCTLTPLAKGSTITLSEGNIDLTNTATWNSVLGTIGMASGKWYWEVNSSDVGNTVNYGVCMSQYDGMTHAQVDVTRIMYSSTGTVYNANGSDTDTGTTYTDDDILGIALNVDDGNIKFYKTNVLVHTETDSDISSNEWVSAQGIYDSGGKMNFGNPSYANTSDAADANGYGAFEFAPPSGYYALCTKNLAEFGG